MLYFFLKIFSSFFIKIYGILYAIFFSLFLQEVGRYKTDFWVESMVTGDVDGDGVNEVILGCQNRTVLAIKLTFS